MVTYASRVLRDPSLMTRSLEPSALKAATVLWEQQKLSGVRTESSMCSQAVRVLLTVKNAGLDTSAKASRFWSHANLAFTARRGPQTTLALLKKDIMHHLVQIGNMNAREVLIIYCLKNQAVFLARLVNSVVMVLKLQLIAQPVIIALLMIALKRLVYTMKR